jgi:hypothetical protein
MARTPSRADAAGRKSDLAAAGGNFLKTVTSVPECHRAVTVRRGFILGAYGDARTGLSGIVDARLTSARRCARETAGEESGLARL